MSLEYADCKECGGEGQLFCWGAEFPEIGPETYAIHCEDCSNEGPIRPSQAEASREWAMLGKRGETMTMSDAIEQGYMAFQQWACGAITTRPLSDFYKLYGGSLAAIDTGRELNKLAKVVCPRKHEKWVHWDSRRDAQCYVDDCGLRMAYSGEMKLE
jgi:hypothetical protein